MPASSMPPETKTEMNVQLATLKERIDRAEGDIRNEVVARHDMRTEFQTILSRSEANVRELINAVREDVKAHTELDMSMFTKLDSTMHEITLSLATFRAETAPWFKVASVIGMGCMALIQGFILWKLFGIK